MKDVKAKPLTPELKWLGQSYPAEPGGEHGPQGARKPEGYVFQLRSNMENIKNIKKKKSLLLTENVANIAVRPPLHLIILELACNSK